MPSHSPQHSPQDGPHSNGESSGEAGTESGPGPVEIRDNPAESRFEVYAGGTLAGFSAYELHGDEVAFTHTEVDSAYEGQGLAAILVTAALDEARSRGKPVLPYCPYVSRFISRRTQYLDLVPAKARKEFGLPAAPTNT
ncbi:MAG: GNAT family N-acetyltransferase [Nocardioidaceae bacterium]